MKSEHVLNRVASYKGCVYLFCAIRASFLLEQQSLGANSLGFESSLPTD